MTPRALCLVRLLAAATPASRFTRPIYSFGVDELASAF